MLLTRERDCWLLTCCVTVCAMFCIRAAHNYIKSWCDVRTTKYVHKTQEVIDHHNIKMKISQHYNKSFIVRWSLIRSWRDHNSKHKERVSHGHLLDGRLPPLCSCSHRPLLSEQIIQKEHAGHTESIQNIRRTYRAYAEHTESIQSIQRVKGVCACVCVYVYESDCSIGRTNSWCVVHMKIHN